jgi:hypothetical protein
MLHGERGHWTSTTVSSEPDASVSSALSLRPRDHLRSSSSALASWKDLIKVDINFPLLKFFSCPNPLMSSVFLCDEFCSFDVWNADGVCCSGLDVHIAQRRLGEFLKWGQWFSKSSRGGYEKPWCSSNTLPLYRLSQPEENGTIGNHFSSFGHTWFQKKLHVLE